jgi:HTH-type transcriptional regulator, glycine betaine synthesis regulator
MSQETSVASSSLAVSGLVVPGGRPAESVAFEEQMVSFFVEAADLLGVPKSVAAIYGVIFASPVPLSFSEVEARLDISKGSISQGLRVLREVGAIRIDEPAARSQEPGLGGSELKAQSSKLKVPISDPPSSISGRGASRRDLYVPDLALRKLIIRFLENRLSKQLAAGTDRLAALDRAVPAGRESEVLRERLKSLKDWHRKTRALLPVVKTFLKVT